MSQTEMNSTHTKNKQNPIYLYSYAHICSFLSYCFVLNSFLVSLYMLRKTNGPTCFGNCVSRDKEDPANRLWTICNCVIYSTCSLCLLMCLPGHQEQVNHNNTWQRWPLGDHSHVDIVKNTLGYRHSHSWSILIVTVELTRRERERETEGQRQRERESEWERVGQM